VADMHTVEVADSQHGISERFINIFNMFDYFHRNVIAWQYFLDTEIKAV
jgi:hypothetical protein